MDPDLRLPSIPDLRRAARRRIPHFAWEYLDGGTGTDTALARNRAALDAVTLLPAALRGPQAPDLTTEFLGTRFSAPFGIAPVGMSGLMWPDAERHLAREAARARIPYGLSTVAAREPEAIGPIAGEMGWFQLYCPADPEIRDDILARARNAGFATLVVTADVPVLSRRERQRRAEIAMPPRVTPRMLMQVAARPAWALGTLRHGRPRFRLMESYARAGGNSVARADHDLRVNPDWDYLAALRARWPGRLILKGVMEPDVAARALAEGCDAVWVSNHGGRQFDGAPAAIEMLPAIRAAVGAGAPLIFDGGVAGGLDILRAIALGADMVMLGRAWHYALGALGARGARHLTHVLTDDLRINLAQIGARRPVDARGRVVHAPGRIEAGGPA